MKAIDIFTQNDGSITKQYYNELNALGPGGQLAVALFRAQKRSTAAKNYGRSRYRGAAYDVKNWSLSEICRILLTYPELGLQWGWQYDSATPNFHHVLYVETPCGQCSFHSPTRGQGPKFEGKWDAARASVDSILEYCDKVSNETAERNTEGSDGPLAGGEDCRAAG
jgi:hypothetical protein